MTKREPSRKYRENQNRQQAVLSRNGDEDEPEPIYWSPTFRKWNEIINPKDYTSRLSDTTDKSFYDNTTHWCVISNQSLQGILQRIPFFDHFPHASEVLLPCWSWFRRQRAVDRCGFALLDGLRLDRTGLNNSWQYQLVQKMGCQVIYTDPKTALNNKDDESKIITYSPSYRRLRPKCSKKPGVYKKECYRVYLDKPSDAHALRRLVISDDVIEEAKGAIRYIKNFESRATGTNISNLPSTLPLQVGFLQRKENGHGRVITNANEIVEGLRLALPKNTNITMDFFEYPRIEDQATYWATKHVIITAHGAAVANAVFITEETIVLQLYPGDWYWQSMEPLVEQSGGIALSWSRNNENPEQKFLQLIKKPWKLKEPHQFGNITAPVDEVVDLILSAVFYDKAMDQWRIRRP